MTDRTDRVSKVCAMIEKYLAIFLENHPEIPEDEAWNAAEEALAGTLRKISAKPVYCVKTFLNVEGRGLVCWRGQQDYDFDTKEEAEAFRDMMQDRIDKKTPENELIDEDGRKTGQHLVVKYVDSNIWRRKNND